MRPSHGSHAFYTPRMRRTTGWPGRIITREGAASEEARADHGPRAVRPTTNARTMVLPDLRADRSSMRRRRRCTTRLNDVFDIDNLRTAANVASISAAMLQDCSGVSFVVEGDEHKCDAFSPPAAYAFSLMKTCARARGAS